MAQTTDIQWCDSTVNPTSGCDGCEILNTCYAKILHEGRLHSNWPGNYAEDFLEVRLIPGRVAGAAHWSDLRNTPRKDKPWLPRHLPRLVFISDLSDALSKAVPFSFLKTEIIDVVAKWQHIGLWLTKRPERMLEFDNWLRDQGVAWPANLVPGTSITRQATLDRAAYLQSIRSPLHFLSVEPILEPIDLTPQLTFGHIEWVIAGFEGGPNARPGNLIWLRNVLRQCREFHVQAFVKQLGSYPVCDSLPDSGWKGQIIQEPPPQNVADYKPGPIRLAPKHKKGGDWSEWPADLQVRQFPKFKVCSL